MIINGRDYKVIGEVESKTLGCNIPLVDLRLMSNEEERHLAEQNAVENYHRIFGWEPENVKTAVQWQIRHIDEMTRKEKHT